MRLLSLSLCIAVACANNVTVDKAPMGSCDMADQASCDKDSSCTWCKCAAVPSKCYTKADAKKLPPGVFACDSVLELQDDANVTIYKLNYPASGECGQTIMAASQANFPLMFGVFKK